MQRRVFHFKSWLPTKKDEKNSSSVTYPDSNPNYVSVLKLGGTSVNRLFWQGSKKNFPSILLPENCHGVKIPINNLTRARIKIDQGQRGPTWFETDTYTNLILMRIGRRTHATKEKAYYLIHMIYSGYNDQFFDI